MTRTTTLKVTKHLRLHSTVAGSFAVGLVHLHIVTHETGTKLLHLIIDHVHRIIFGAVGLEAEAAQLFAAAIAADHRIHWIHLLCVTHAISLVMYHLNVGLAYSVMRAASWAIMRMIVSNESGKVVIVILSNIMQIFRHRLHRTTHLMIPHNVANAIVLWLSHHIHHPWHYIP